MTIDPQVWLSNALPGDSVEYYQGDLAYDAYHERKLRRSSQVQDIRDAWWWAYEAGYVNLVQRRVGRHNFAYIAQKRPDARPAAARAPKAKSKTPQWRAEYMRNWRKQQATTNGPQD